MIRSEATVMCDPISYRIEKCVRGPSGQGARANPKVLSPNNTPDARRSTVCNSTKDNSSATVLSSSLLPPSLSLSLFIHRSIPLIPGSLTLIENFATPSPSWDINIHRRAERRLTLHPLGITLIHPRPISPPSPARFSARLFQLIIFLLPRPRDRRATA